MSWPKSRGSCAWRYHHRDRCPRRPRLRAEGHGPNLAGPSVCRHSHRAVGPGNESTLHPAYAALARAYVDTQRWADGLEAAERGLSIDDSDADLIRAYAYALQSVGSYNDAETYLQRAMQLRPTYLPIHFELGGLYLARDDDESAIDIYNRILSLEPRNARAMLRLCLAYRKVGEFARALALSGLGGQRAGGR